MFDYQAPSDLLKDKIILVSGAGSGIGKAAALAYAHKGATVILLGRTVEKLEQVYDEIEKAGAPQAAITPFDLAGANDDNYQELVNSIHANFGRLDGLLNNASILGTLTPIQSYSLNTWNQVIQTNLNAQFALSKYCLPLLQEAENASIIFTSSGAGRKPYAYWGAYSVSKAATEALAQVLFLELENTSKIRVNTINPGSTATKMRSQAFPGENPEKVAKAEDIMPAYLYLMGNGSLQENGKQFDAQ
ncbi:MAG: YciK family oxidoreductase [SAR86 cluster bacterium]|uniref:YciK family oxidoreductase n=1 Tax=SAR86 cluster bacterium TaxID=2030880 RepID=A0A2A5CC05_9GAMM|nr:YciK family oxidoreductase [Gammaproteobacteria bacterium AH-315-E17]PCJ41424.1 MAG: YciK family oxidoreductase [SAR86 cluster bacterium]